MKPVIVRRPCDDATLGALDAALRVTPRVHRAALEALRAEKSAQRSGPRRRGHPVASHDERDAHFTIAMRVEVLRRRGRMSRDKAIETVAARANSVHMSNGRVKPFVRSEAMILKYYNTHKKAARAFLDRAVNAYEVENALLVSVSP